MMMTCVNEPAEAREILVTFRTWLAFQQLISRHVFVGKMQSVVEAVSSSPPVNITRTVVDQL